MNLRAPLRACCLFLPFLIAGPYLSCQQAEARNSKQKPNVLIIYADDLGYGDVSVYNPDRGKIPTPHIDQLAKEGMRFTDGHSSSSVCSPSRYTLLTGRYHWRTRLQSGIVNLWERPLIKEDRLTIGGLAQREGYRTACIGKWHLGWDWPISPEDKSLFQSRKKDVLATAEHRRAWKEAFSQPIEDGPTTRGFDSYFGTAVPNWPPYCFIRDNRTVGIPSTFLDPKLLRNNQASKQGPALEEWKLKPILPTIGRRAADVIRTRKSTEEPFLLYLPLTSPHTPLAVTDRWRGESGLNLYADFVMETDAIVGNVLEALKESGQKQNTLVVFTSDNGCAPYIGADHLENQGHDPSGPLRGYKSDVWEGGHRIPFIVRWPGVVEPGTERDELVHQVDLMATFADIVNHKLPPDAGEDSVSFLPLLKGQEGPTRRVAISTSMNGLFSIRRGPWKLIFGPGSGGWTEGKSKHPAQLYHLGQDLDESDNRYADKPDRVRSLTDHMEQVILNGRSTPGPPQSNDVRVRWRGLPEERTSNE